MNVINDMRSFATIREHEIENVRVNDELHYLHILH